MSLTSGLIKAIGYPFLLWYRGESEILRQYRALREFDRVSQEGLDAHRLQRLRALLGHAARTSPFYQARIRSAGLNVEAIDDIAILKMLPFLTKSELNSQMEQVLSSAFRRDELSQSSTGGSSGVPLTFYRDAHVTAVRRAQDYFFNARLGVYPGTKRAWVWGSPIDANRLASFKARAANFLSERAINFYSFDATSETMSSFLAKLGSHRPEVIIAYPNMLAAIAEHARERAIPVPAVSKIITTAEPTYQWHRDLFRDVFGAETFERYGSREFGTLAAEDSAHDGMHIFEPTYIIEVIDANGRDVPAGQMGELVVTDLCNYAMPLIRYRTGDMVAVSAPQPGDASRWRRISSVGGRVVDLIVRPDGTRIAGEALIMALRTSGFVDRVQVIQRTPQLLIIRHLRDAQIAGEIKAAFLTNVHHLLGATVTIEYQPVAELTYDPSGKYRYVTSECMRDETRSAR